MILNYVLVAVCLVSTIILHELGHLDAFRRLGRKAKVVFGKTGLEIKADYNGLRKDQLHMIYLEGVVVGCVPILMITFIIPTAGLFLIPYLMMSRSDIKQIINTADKQ